MIYRRRQYLENDIVFGCHGSFPCTSDTEMIWKIFASSEDLMYAPASPDRLSHRVDFPFQPVTHEWQCTSTHQHTDETRKQQSMYPYSPISHTRGWDRSVPSPEDGDVTTHRFVWFRGHSHRNGDAPEHQKGIVTSYTTFHSPTTPFSHPFPPGMKLTHPLPQQSRRGRGVI